MCFVFFFFKQKTAYDMRISDWSSDVCSSDLPDWSGSQANNTGDALVAAQRVGAEVDRMDSAWFAPAVKVPGENRARPLFIERSQIGRASCRERVCQSV